MIEYNINEAISKLIKYGQRLDQKNLLSSFDGNISLRLTNEHILITKSGCMKGLLSLEDFVVVDLNGQKVNGFLEDQLNLDQRQKEALKVSIPSSETIMHVEIYKNQKNARSVFHAHPPTAIAFSVAHPKLKYFPLNYISELILALGEVPMVDYQRPGTPQMGEALRPFLNKAKVMILKYHGVVSWGEDIQEAYRGIERIEHAAEIYLKAVSFGGVNQIEQSEMDYLKELRKKIGFKNL